MTDTPETDKAGKFWPCEQEELVDADFARRLERERDQARDALMRIHGATCTLHTDDQRSKMRCPICLERERDEAQYKLKDAQQSLEVALADLSEARAELARLGWRLTS